MFVYNLYYRRYDRVHKKTSACNIIPMQPEEESVDSLLGNTDIHTQKMISKSDWLSDFLGGLDKSCESIAFSFSPHGTPFTFSAIGPGISSETSYPEHSEPFINFECDRDLSFSYLYSHIILCKKALEHAVEVSIEMSLNGSLCMLFQIESSQGVHDFVEFTFVPMCPPID
ncbi:unnamed protein product [Rhizopus stolonifer]